MKTENKQFETATCRNPTRGIDAIGRSDWNPLCQGVPWLLRPDRIGGHDHLRRHGRSA